MKRILSLVFTTLLTLSASAQFTDGYYRLQCKETGRYLAVHNDYVDKESAKRTGQVELHSLETITGFDNIVNDPGSIIYLKNTKKGYVIEAQGFTTEGRGLYLQFYQVDDAYRIYTTVTYEGTEYTRYLRDCDGDDGRSYITTDADKSKNWHWYVTPVKDDKYFGLKGDVKVGNSYYTTIYAAFPFQLGSGMKAYAVNSLTEGTCTLQDIGDIVPSKVPVVIACAGQDAASNKVTPLPKNNTTADDNHLDGVTFCYLVIVAGSERRRSPYWNALDYNPSTMRVLGEADGKLCFVSPSELKYVPANTAYLSVSAGSAETIPTDGTTGIKSTKLQIQKTVKGRFTLQGVQIPDNVEPRGPYIEDGKVVFKK